MKSHTQYPPSGTKNKDIGSSRRKRWCMMLIGNLIIGFAIGLYRLSRFGVDPFASLTLGLNFLTHISFGTCMAAAAAVFLAIQFLFDRKTIGAGTVLNMLVGYIADLTVWLSDSVLHLNYTMTVRIILLVAGTVLVSLGIAMYMDAKLGISPSNAVILILQKVFHGRLSFRVLYILTDLCCVILGGLCCILAHVSIWKAIGAGTLISVILTGPLVSFWSRHFAAPLLGENPKTSL